MSQYVAITTDQLQPALARHDGTTYSSPPQPHHHAVALACALAGVAPFRTTRDRGVRPRTVRIAQAP